jgi:ABC-type glutathione transport system ATPase component
MTPGDLLEIQDLRVEFAGRRRQDAAVLAADGVSLRIGDGETLGLVGESGSGKSTIGNAVLGLVKPTTGRILFRGRDVTHATTRERRQLSQHIQVVFQDPYSSLNPSRSIGQTLSEALRLVRKLDRRSARTHVTNVLRHVGMPADTMSRYPSEFSGGQRQRIAIARALVMDPDLVICDEPTSALDLSVQAQILNLLLDLQARLGLGYLFISHDIDVVRHMSHRVAVLLHGRVVEQGPTDSVTRRPGHEYTQALVAAVPSVDAAAGTPPSRRSPHRDERGDA